MKDRFYVPQDLQFQRAAWDPNLGKQTSELMRLSPSFHARFGDGAGTLTAHLEARTMGLWEYLVPDVESARAPKAWHDGLVAMADLANEVGR